MIEELYANRCTSTLVMLLVRCSAQKTDTILIVNMLLPPSMSDDMTVWA
jgi:hypothetical protein